MTFLTCPPKKKDYEKLIHETLFVYDWALMAQKENHLQTIIGRFGKASQLFEHAINLRKTKVQAQVTQNKNKPTNHHHQWQHTKVCGNFQVLV